MLSLMNILFLLSALSPLMIFLDYRKKENIRFSLIYIVLFYLVIFIVFRLAYDYGIFLAALAPIVLLVICIRKKKQ